LKKLNPTKKRNQALPNKKGEGSSEGRGGGKSRLSRRWGQEGVFASKDSAFESNEKRREGQDCEKERKQKEEN